MKTWRSVRSENVPDLPHANLRLLKNTEKHRRFATIKKPFWCFLHVLGFNQGGFWIRNCVCDIVSPVKGWGVAIESHGLTRVQNGWHSKFFFLGGDLSIEKILLRKYLILDIQTPVEKVFGPPKYVTNTKPQEVFGGLGLKILRDLFDLFVLRGQTECSIWWAFSLWFERSQRLCRVFDDGQHWLGPSRVPQMLSVSETHNSQYLRFVVNMCPFLANDANGDWMLLHWKVLFPFQTLDFAWFWICYFLSSEWIPMIEYMSSQKFPAKGCAMPSRTKLDVATS